MQIDEEWREAAGFPKYLVSNLGRVRNRKTSLILKPMMCGQHGNKYCTLHLCYKSVTPNSINTLGKAVKLHRLVLYTFRGPPPLMKPYGLHLDEDRTNNALSNLAWGSPKDNARMITKRIDQKLSHANRVEIIELLKQGARTIELAKKFGVSPQRISDFKYGRHYQVTP